MLTVSYAELEAALAAGGASVAAAEAHGSLCGALAASAGYSAEDWLDGLLAAGAAPGSEALRARDLLETLHTETAAAFVGQEMEFMPLLPDDGVPLERRVSALAEWCSGFLFGFGARRAAGEALPDAVGEVLRDFGEISRAIVGGGESEESNEGAYAELVEYLRAAAQLVYDDLGAERAGPARA